MTPLERPFDEFAITQGIGVDLVLPTLFVAGAFINQNPHLISIALNVISDYLIDFFKSVYKREPTESDTVRMKIVKSRGKTYKKISYEGPVSGLDKFAEIVRES